MLKREVGQGYSKQAFCGDSGVSPKGVSRKDSTQFLAVPCTAGGLQTNKKLYAFFAHLQL